MVAVLIGQREQFARVATDQQPEFEISVDSVAKHTLLLRGDVAEFA